MAQEFKDLFSTQATDYSRYRPKYPKALFRHLASLCSETKLAWDVGTGNGQAAIGLAEFFEKVVATDLSEKQLNEAPAHEKVNYRIGSAVRSDLSDQTVDLITAAQAFHWFAGESFFQECKRVAKPGSIIAFWCYPLAEIKPDVDQVVQELYEDVLGSFWEPERELVESGYRDIAVPFDEIEAPKVFMGAEWHLADLIGYLGTWSALQRYRKETGNDPRSFIFKDLQAAWGNISLPLSVKWQIQMRIFRWNGAL